MARTAESNYSYYMPRIELKVARIGNSRGIRIPAATLKRYQIGQSVVMEERSDGILLRKPGPVIPKLSWEDTAVEMERAGEDWSDWDATISDGLEQIPWEVELPRRVAEKQRTYRAPQVTRKK